MARSRDNSARTRRTATNSTRRHGHSEGLMVVLAAFALVFVVALGAHAVARGCHIEKNHDSWSAE